MPKVAKSLPDGEALYGPDPLARGQRAVPASKPAPGTPRNSGPQPHRIAFYWLLGDGQRRLERPIPVGYARPACFACGKLAASHPGWTPETTAEERWRMTPVGLQRAHIVPHCDGGPAVVENLLMLCLTCHREQEELYPVVGVAGVLRWVVNHESEVERWARIAVAAVGTGLAQLTLADL